MLVTARTRAEHGVGDSHAIVCRACLRPSPVVFLLSVSGPAVELHSRIVSPRILLLIGGVLIAPGGGKMPEGFVDVAEVARDIVVDARYAGSNNFLGRPARGYGAGRCLLTKPAATALAEVQRDVAAFGLGLMVYDCYRPQRAVDDFTAWSRDAKGDATNPSHHPVVPRSQLFARGYIAARSGHSRGSTVDLTLIPAGPLKRAAIPPRDCRSIAGPLAPDGSLNMGTTFDCFDERAHTADAGVPAEARRNRLLLKMAMEKRGFVAYEPEWWHFTLANEPHPRTAFDFEIEPAR
jgi:D-alanyl-D-alanine dipeptidase